MHKARAFFYVCAGLFLLALSYHLGARNATAQSPAAGEVAVSMGSVGPGGYIPLPTYQDGTTALEAECRWIVSPGNVNMSRIAPVLRCETLTHTGGIQMYYLSPDDPLDRSRANYMIIAVRSGGPTPAQQETWGALKSRYRGERGAAQPATQDR